MSANSKIFSVSQLNAAVSQLLEAEFASVWLEAEVGQFTAAASGHWYFTLKDARSQVRCAMFKGRNGRVSFNPKQGDQVLVRARVGLYEPRGEFQLIAESMQPAGVGRLQQAFEALKLKLSQEGLFDQDLKQPLPMQRQRIGVITSATGAALHDILTVLQRRDPALQVILYPTQVQGAAATEAIVSALRVANARDEVDVLLVGRGGGSLEELWCFNEEAVARAIVDSHIPVISAVGHEVDVTIADFVADLRAATPSAAAELVSRDRSDDARKLQSLQQRLHAAWIRHKNLQQQGLQQLNARLLQQHPQRRLEQQAQQLDDLSARLHAAMQRKLTHAQQQWLHCDNRLSLQALMQRIQSSSQHQQQLQTRLQQAMDANLQQAQQQWQLQSQSLNLMSPLNTLTRGYAINRDAKGRVLQSISQVKPGDTISAQLSDGEISATVAAVQPSGLFGEPASDDH